MDGLLSREDIKDGLIELINSIVLGREDGTFKEELVIHVSLINAWIDGVEQVLDVVLRETHVLRELYGLVRREVRTCTNFQEPLSKSITLWSTIQAHILSEMQDLYMPPQPRLAQRGIDNLYP